MARVHGTCAANAASFDMVTSAGYIPFPLVKQAVAPITWFVVSFRASL